MTGDPAGKCAVAASMEPGFAMAMALEAFFIVMSGGANGRTDERVVSLRRRLQYLVDSHHCNFRERSFVAALHAWSDGRIREAAAILEGWLLEQPHDVLAVRVLHGEIWQRQRPDCAALARICPAPPASDPRSEGHCPRQTSRRATHADSLPVRSRTAQRPPPVRPFARCCADTYYFLGDAEQLRDSPGRVMGGWDAQRPGYLKVGGGLPDGPHASHDRPARRSHPAPAVALRGPRPPPPSRAAVWHVRLRRPGVPPVRSGRGAGHARPLGGDGGPLGA